MGNINVIPSFQSPLKNRIESLDSLRGIAALSVFLSHYVEGFYWPPSFKPWFLNSPLIFLADGFAGVAVFFVLSGFVLSLKYLKKKGRPLNSFMEVVKFWAARAFRIMPAFLAILILSAVSKLALDACHFQSEAIQQGLVKFWVDPVTIGRVVREAFIFSPAPPIHLLPQDWTLTVEMNVSFLMPLFIWLASKHLILLYGVAGLLLHRRWYLAHFALGITLAKFFSRRNESSLKKHRLVNSLMNGFIFVVGLFLLSIRLGKNFYFSPNVADALSETSVWYLMGLGAGAIIWVTLKSVTLQRTLNHRILTYLGKISYSIYLVHFILLKVLTAPLLSILQGTFGRNSNLAYFIAFVVSLGAVIVVSHLSFIFFELPALKLGYHVSSFLTLKLPKKVMSFFGFLGV